MAEVASTFNEALLIDHVLKQIKDDATRLALLGNYLENIKATVFRQTQFAEFELRMHERAERGQPLTGDALAKLYMDITKKYYGNDEGVCIVDDYVANEWSFIPHFYSDFYVFQYATSFTASSALVGEGAGGGRGGDEALPCLPFGGRLQIPDRPAEGRGRGHDDGRTAEPDGGEDEPGDGRDGETAGKDAGQPAPAIEPMRHRDRTHRRDRDAGNSSSTPPQQARDPRVGTAGWARPGRRFLR